VGTKEWERLEDLFHATLQLEVADRSDYLIRECSGDEELRRKVESLVTASQDAPAFIDTPAVSIGLRVLSVESNNSMIGKDVGPYKIISALGKGGMGEVYLAEDTRLGRKVALKFLSGEFVGDNWAKRQLIKEAQAVAMLDHPNICPVYGIEEDEGLSFIVMQYVEGETLSDLIHSGRLDPNEVLPLARQIVGALAEAHAHGIIHRDIKPKNIMVTPGGQVKVLDFGLAKTIQQKKSLELIEESVSHLSQNGLIPGTVAYMSPEQLRGERLDLRSDIFSLGTVLYELVEGQKLFARASEAETISAILTSEAPPLKNDHFNTGQLDQIINKCLEKDRDGRYHSASELLIELSTSPTTSSQPKSSRYLRPGAGIMFLALVLVSVFLYVGLQNTNSNAPTVNNLPPSTTPVYSLAVMPVTSENPDRSDDYLSDGLTESLINKFSSLSRLKVSPYTSVLGYKGKAIDPMAVGVDLKVDALLLGHIVQRGDKQVLQSKLVRAADGSQIWAGDGEIKWQTIFSLEDQLAKSVTDSLKLRLVDEETFLASHGTSSPEAFRQYMLGRYYWKNRDKENINKAIGYFKGAIKLDPIYARAYAGLADSYVLLSTVSFGKMSTEDAMTQASAAAKEALVLNPELVEAHTSLGVVSLRYEWDWQNAEKEFKWAIEMQSDYAPAHYWYSQLLLVTGRREEAVLESEKAKKLDPFSPPSVMNFCRTLSLSRQYDKAISCYDNLLAQNPKFEHAKYLRGLVYQRSGRYGEALLAFQSLYSTNRALAGAALGYAYGRAGMVDEALSVLTEMKALSKQRFVPPIEFAIIYIGLGDKENAFAWLEAAYKERFATLIYITVDPIFASLYTDPRYISLVQRLKLPLPSIS
jgi:serine/threonine-protein kinase